MIIAERRVNVNKKARKPFFWLSGFSSGRLYTPEKKQESRYRTPDTAWV